MTKARQDDLRKMNISEYFSRLSSSLQNLSTEIANFNASSNDILKGNGFDAIRARMNYYVDGITKASKICDIFSNNVVAANNQLIVYMEDLSEIDNALLGEAEELLTQTKNDLLRLESYYEHTYTNANGETESVWLRVGSDAEIAECKEHIAYLEHIIKKMRGLDPADKGAFATLEAVSTDITNFDSAVNGISVMDANLNSTDDTTVEVRTTTNRGRSTTTGRKVGLSTEWGIDDNTKLTGEQQDAISEFNANAIYEYFKEKGIGDAGIAVILANSDCECAMLNTGITVWNVRMNHADKKHDPDPRNEDKYDYYGSVGLFSWTDGTDENGIKSHEREKYFKYCDENGYDYKDTYVQLDYLMYQLESQDDYQDFVTASNKTDVKDAAVYFSTHIENPESGDTRIGRASWFYDDIQAGRKLQSYNLHPKDQRVY